MKRLQAEPWFHGAIEREAAERRLLHRGDGTFLVRLSKNKPDHPFTVSVMRPARDGVGCAPQHKRIRMVHGTNQWFAPVAGRTQCYESLEAMIADPECGLTTPYPVDEVSNPYISSYFEEDET